VSASDFLRLKVARRQSTDSKPFFFLTDKGASQFEKFEKCAALISAADAGLFTEVCEVGQCVDLTTAALEKKPLSERIRASG